MLQRNLAAIPPQGSQSIGRLSVFTISRTNDVIDEAAFVVVQNQPVCGGPRRIARHYVVAMEAGDLGCVLFTAKLGMNSTSCRTALNMLLSNGWVFPQPR